MIIIWSCQSLYVEANNLYTSTVYIANNIKSLFANTSKYLPRIVVSEITFSKVYYNNNFTVKTLSNEYHSKNFTVLILIFEHVDEE